MLRRLEKRTDHQHRGTRRSHDVRERRARDKEREVSDRAAGEVPADMNAAGHDKERADEKNKRNEVTHQRFIQGDDTVMKPESERERNNRHCGPGKRDLAEVVVPEIREDQRHERDGKKNAGERNRPHDGQIGSLHLRCVGDCRHDRGHQGQRVSSQSL